MDNIKKKIASWEIQYGQIAITGSDYNIAKKLFEGYFGRTFELVTFKGNFPNRHFIHEGTRNSLRLACKPFFGALKEGSVIYIKPLDMDRINVLEGEPIERVDSIEGKELEQVIPKGTSADITKLLIDLVKENRQLREENEELLIYKDRLEKYQNLEYIFEDEMFMEDWLERNIHKVLSNLEVIDRQPIITWNEAFMRNKPDFFCLDKTTRELVIVENKVRGRHRKVETQLLTYRAWVNRNVDKINEKYKNNNLKATENFKFVIITDTTDERLEAICEDNMIALVLIDGGVVFEALVPY
jgi:hypothetical protein